MSHIDNSYEYSEYYSSDDDYYHDEEIIYEPDEISNTKYNLILYEKYNNKIHGKPLTKKIIFYNLVVMRFKTFNIDYINNYIRDINHYRRTRYVIHKTEIAECIYLDTGECIAIIKTIWLKLIQRLWKKIYSLKKEIIYKRKMLSSIRYREINGRWPPLCNNIPTLKGMLYNLKNYI